MEPARDILLSIRQMMKLYDQHMEETRKHHQLSQLEITIISFLHNNPSCDTAKEISQMRMLPKGNVSQGVESLIQKSLLRRVTDARDRRRIHLSLTDCAQPIVAEIECAKERFHQQLFSGFTPEEIMRYAEMNERISKNTRETLKGEI